MSERKFIVVNDDIKYVTIEGCRKFLGAAYGFMGNCLAYDYEEGASTEVIEIKVPPSKWGKTYLEDLVCVLDLNSPRHKDWRTIKISSLLYDVSLKSPLELHEHTGKYPNISKQEIEQHYRGECFFTTARLRTDVRSLVWCNHEEKHVIRSVFLKGQCYDIDLKNPVQLMKFTGHYPPMFEREIPVKNGAYYLSPEKEHIYVNKSDFEDSVANVYDISINGKWYSLLGPNHICTPILRHTGLRLLSEETICIYAIQSTFKLGEVEISPVSQAQFMLDNGVKKEHLKWIKVNSHKHLIYVKSDGGTLYNYEPGFEQISPDELRRIYDAGGFWRDGKHLCLAYHDLATDNYCQENVEILPGIDVEIPEPSTKPEKWDRIVPSVKFNMPLVGGGEPQVVPGGGGAVRVEDGRPRYDLIPPSITLALAETFREGAEKYSEGNCFKGLPMSNLYNHAIAHLELFRMGDRSEPHLAHALWNIGMMHEFDVNYPEMNDLRKYFDGYPKSASSVCENATAATEPVSDGHCGCVCSKPTENSPNS